MLVSELGRDEKKNTENNGERIRKTRYRGQGTGISLMKIPSNDGHEKINLNEYTFLAKEIYTNY